MEITLRTSSFQSYGRRAWRASLIPLLAGCSPRTAPGPALTQTSLAASQRPIRRDIPITNTIRRAFAAGTRDSSGRPGAKYWQLWMEYEINARLDVPTSTITGRENVTLHNNSGVALDAVVLRLDQNYFAPNAARVDPISPSIEITPGMKVTRLSVDGQLANLNPPAQPRGSTVNPAANG